MTTARLLPLAAFLLALGLAAWRISPPPTAPLQPPAGHTAQALPAEVERDTLPRFGQPTGGASLAMLADGRLAAAWQGQLDNGDAALWFSLRGSKGWQAPVVAAMRESSAAGSLARLDGLGRPLLQVEGSQLSLWYASSVFGEAGSGALYVGRSSDGGKSWQNARRQRINPIAARGGEAVALLARSDGSSLLAIAEDGLLSQGRWLHVAADGRLLAQARQSALPHAPWGAVVALDAARALALAGHAGRLHTLSSNDGGEHWQVGHTLPAEIADQPAALLRLADGRLLLAAQRSDRQALQFWLSADDGSSWRANQIIEQGDDGAADFSRPALVQTRDDRIHLIYSWRQQGIRHLRCSPAWLAEVAA